MWADHTANETACKRVKNTENALTSQTPLVTVGRRVAPPPAASKPCLPVSRHTAPQCINPCHRYAGQSLSLTSAWHLYAMGKEIASGLQSRVDSPVCHKTRLSFVSRCLSIHRPHVSLSIGFPDSLCFLGNPTPLQPTAGCLLTCLGQSCNRVTSFRMSI